MKSYENLQHLEFPHAWQKYFVLPKKPRQGLYTTFNLLSFRSTASVARALLLGESKIVKRKIHNKRGISKMKHIWINNELT